MLLLFFASSTSMASMPGSYGLSKVDIQQQHLNAEDSNVSCDACIL